MTGTPTDLKADLDFSLVRDDRLIRAQRGIGLIPRDGLGIGRRAVFFGLLAWLPIAAWAWLEQRFLPGRVAEPFVQHFGIHARCLFAIPMFILCEATAQHVGRGVIGHLVVSGLVKEHHYARLQEMLASVARLRDNVVPWLVVAALVAGWTASGVTLDREHEIAFAAALPGETPRLAFGAWWFLYVSRVIFVALLGMWLWRLAIWTLVLWKISRLDLALVPTHADRMFGLGPLARTPMAFWPLVLGMSVVLCSTWAHDIAYHGANEHTLIIPAVLFAAAVVVAMFAPLLVFVPLLARARLDALADYGALVARHGRLVHGKWILGRDPGPEPLLAAPELGPVADVVTLYGAVQAQRVAPISWETLAAVLIPLAMPMVAVVAMRVPIGELLLDVVKKLI